LDCPTYALARPAWWGVSQRECPRRRRVAGLTLALIAYERGEERIREVLAVGYARGFVPAIPATALAEVWRGDVARHTFSMAAFPFAKPPEARNRGGRGVRDKARNMAVSGVGSGNCTSSASASLDDAHVDLTAVWSARGDQPMLPRGAAQILSNDKDVCWAIVS
jgi:hypothetical protein